MIDQEVTDPLAARTALPTEKDFDCYLTGENQFKFFSNNAKYIGLHQFEIVAKYVDFPLWPELNTIFDVNVDVVVLPDFLNIAPRFVSHENWVTPQYIGCGQKFV